MQVARQKKKKEQETDPLVENDPFTQSAQEEADALERDRQARLTIADYQKSQIRSKQDQEAQQKKARFFMYKLKRQAHFDFYVDVNKKIAQEIKAAKENDAKKAKEFKQNWRKALQGVMEGKQAVTVQEKEESAHLDKANERFLNRKSYIASKHREVIGNRYKWVSILI